MKHKAVLEYSVSLVEAAEIDGYAMRTTGTQVACGMDPKYTQHFVIGHPFQFFFNVSATGVEN